MFHLLVVLALSFVNVNKLGSLPGCPFCDSSFTHDDTTTVSDCGSIKLPLSGVGSLSYYRSDLTGTQSGLTTVYINGLSIGECPYQTGPGILFGPDSCLWYFQTTLSVPTTTPTPLSLTLGDTYFHSQLYTSSGTLICPKWAGHIRRLCCK